MERLLKAAKSVPDPDATAIVWRLRLRSGVAQAKQKPIKYGELNDADFKADLGKYGL